VDDARARIFEGVRRQHDIADRGIVRQHRENDVRLKGVARRGNHLHALDRQACMARAVPTSNLVAGLGDVSRHRAAHSAKSDESDFHGDAP